MDRVYNFSAGPATLPHEVVLKAQAELLSFKDSGMSVMEISHRSDLYTTMASEAEQDLRDLMQIPDNYEVLFLQGGATQMFYTLPLNFANQAHRVGYINTGHWSERAEEEARYVSGLTVEEVGSSADQHFTELVHQVTLNGDYDFIHLTTNNTIEGTMYRDLPELDGRTLVADLSSNFLGQVYNVNDFGIIYAGAQKNSGIAGFTVAIVRKDLLEQVPDLPAMLSFSKQAAKHSALNTPPVFAIYMAGLVFKWIKEQGGVAAMQKRNEAKAQLLYEFLDSSNLFRNPVVSADRSTMNIPFVTGDADLDALCVQEATKQGLMSLKGHKSVGGLRASLYNAMTIDGVQALVKFLGEFEKEHGGK